MAKRKKGYSSSGKSGGRPAILSLSRTKKAGVRAKTYGAPVKGKANPRRKMKSNINKKKAYGTKGSGK
tara:strand:- start:27413 stop:27616 length:204 start_codon:yes stop_codon:yes gene_type:complete